MDQRHYVVVTSEQQPFNVSEQVGSSVCDGLQLQSQLLTAQNTITIPINIQNEVTNIAETTELQLTLPQMEECATQLSIVPNNIIVPVQQYQPGETIILSSALPTFPIAQVSTSRIIFTPEDLGMTKESYLVTTTNGDNNVNTDNSITNSTSTQVTVVTPDGEEKEIVFCHSPEKLNVPYILYKVCRSIGIDDTMEGHMDCESEEVREQRKQQMQDLFVQCEQEEKMESTNDNKPLKAKNNGVVYCSLCHVVSKDDKRCHQCRRALSRSSLTEIKMFNENSKEFEVKKRKCPRKHKKPDEPVCLTISSDEGEGDEEKDETLNNGKSITEENDHLTSLRLKEPIITETTEAPMQTRIEGGGVDLTELLDSPVLEKALLQCRTVRIGSYKVFPKEKLTLNEYGIKFKVPSMNGEQTMVKILRTDIVKVLAHFGNQMPVLFYYTTNGAGIKIRNALQMPHKPESIYFDPTSTVEMHRRITLLPDKIPGDTRLFIKSIYDGQCLLDELSSKEANEILVKTVPKEIPSHMATRAKDNFQGASSGSSAVVPKIQTIMVYPPPPTKGGISINTEDYACLGEDQFLNDVIIDFYLKWLFLTKLSPEDQKRTHIFSSFFYKRLTTKASPGGFNKYQDDPKLSPAEKRHARVKGWTKSVDLFSKDFIIIPINENCHWFLGIICFPGLTHAVRLSDNIPISIPSKRSTKRPVPSMIGATTITVVQSEPMITVEGEEEERDEADADDEDLEPNTSDDEGKESSQDGTELMDEATPRLTRSIKMEPEEPIKQPCILIFDSLAGASRSRVCATLREYLQVEYNLKHKGSKRDFSKDTVRGAVPKVPQQTNYTDCGLYVLQYVEAFFSRPITNFKMPIKMLKEWFPTDIVARKRYDIQQLLHKLMEEQKVDISRLNLPQLNLHPDGGGNTSLVNYSDEGDEFMEECDVAVEEGEIEDHEPTLGAMAMAESEIEDEEEEHFEEDELEEEEEEEDEDDRGIIAPEIVMKREIPDKKIVTVGVPQKPNLSNLGEITISSTNISASAAIGVKRKITPGTLKEVRNPRLSRQTTPDNKKMRSD
ncbi:uncharacterized protein LOC106662776 isoform X2 [Cimex lectularius]|uniref:Ubiquitin-like protease family profile domain-containing protein n=1 Tax=Cimex lectularius TaxID=79782 RepID=A0A8I6SKU5_CIMLE|nr:uncharacterized protein LOC106662776 isoform X2 [Cimex lectularius]